MTLFSWCGVSVLAPLDAPIWSRWHSDSISTMNDLKKIQSITVPRFPNRCLSLLLIPVVMQSQIGRPRSYRQSAPTHRPLSNVDISLSLFLPRLYYPRPLAPVSPTVAQQPEAVGFCHTHPRKLILPLLVPTLEQSCCFLVFVCALPICSRC